jgi:predicted MFS family arabinose efflux permease
LQEQSRRIALTSAVIHGLVHGSVMMLPPLIGDFHRAFGVSHLQVLGALNVMYLVYGLAAVPAGYLADRYGSRLMLVLAALGSTGALLLVSSAPTFSLLAAGLVLLGLAAGLYHPSGLSLLSRGVASGERGRAMGIHGAGGNWGEVIAPVWVTFFAETLGWRWGFIAAAALSAACALLALTLPAEPRPSHASSTGGFVGLLRTLASTTYGYWRNRPLRWVLLALIGAGFAYRGFYTFLAMHLQDSVGGERRAGYFMTGILLAGVFGQRYGGSLADRVPRERLFLILAACSAPVLALMSVSSGLTLLVASVLFSLVWSAAQPVANALTAAYADTRNHGFLYGVQFALTFGMGSFATGGGGLLQSFGGTRLAYAGFAAVAALEFLAVLSLVRAVRHAQRIAPSAVA